MGLTLISFDIRSIVERLEGPMKLTFVRIAIVASLAASMSAAFASARAQGLVMYDPQQWTTFVSQKAFTEGRQLVDANGNCLHAQAKNAAEGLNEGANLISQPCNGLAPEQRFVVEGNTIKATLVAKEYEGGGVVQAPWFSVCMTSISLSVSGVPSSVSAALSRCGGSQKPFQGYRFDNGRLLSEWSRGWCMQGGDPKARNQNIYAMRCDDSAAQKWTWR